MTIEDTVHDNAQTTQTPDVFVVSSEDDRRAELTELTELTEEVRGLRDLFARRLMEDKTKKAMFDELYSQMQFAREGLVKTTLVPVISELILIIDRMESALDQSEMVASVRDELLEVLARRGVNPIPTGVGEPFSAAAAEVVGVVESDLPGSHIVSVERTGYRQGESLLRAVQVTISRS